MGILKKSGSWKNCTHKKRVTFGKELHPKESKPVKEFDGMCGKTKSWYYFVDLVFNLEVSPQLAWDRVPPKHSDFVWNCILNLLDEFMYKGQCISMPMGHPRAFYIGEPFYNYVNDLALWVRDQIYYMRTQDKNLEKMMGGWLTFDDDINIAHNELYSKKEDEIWDNIKENICA